MEKKQLEIIFGLARQLPMFKGIEDGNLREVIQERYGNSPLDKLEALIKNLKSQIEIGAQKLQKNVEKVKSLKFQEETQSEKDKKLATDLLKRLEEL